MHIDPPTNRPVSPCGGGVSGPIARRPATGTNTPTGSPAVDAEFTPTSGLRGLLGAVRDLPDVRPDRVAAAARSAAAGELTTADAAHDAARAILGGAAAGG